MPVEPVEPVGWGGWVGWEVKLHLTMKHDHICEARAAGAAGAWAESFWGPSMGLK